MAPKRKAVDRAPEPAPKRQKPKSEKARAAEKAAERAAAAAAMIKNATDSPLLRLPAELRNRIMEMLYGGGTLHICFKNWERKLTSTLRCRPCGPDKDKYEPSKCCTGPLSSSISIPVVCKQFWGEASTTFFASNAFSIDDPQAFRAVILACTDFVGRIRTLNILGRSRHYTCVDDFARAWGSALNSALMGHFKSLRGIRINIPLNETELALFEDKDVMRSAGWRATKMPEVIRACQQHQMEPSLTSVHFVYGRIFWAGPAFTLPATVSPIEDLTYTSAESRPSYLNTDLAAYPSGVDPKEKIRCMTMEDVAFFLNGY